jgi:Saccharopine dehydrogenase NADP binding domain
MGVVVFGGYGAFGSQVSRALAAVGVPVAVAGRDINQAEALARELGPECRGLAANVTNAASCRDALRGQTVAVNCAGPFGRFDTTLLDACLEAGCHYADIADDRSYTGWVRARGDRFRERGLAAVHGCSSLPGISGALGLLAVQQADAVPVRARVTLFIGNNNPKGEAAVRSLLGGLGRPITAPQGTLHGFRDREVVPLPQPFGRRGVFNFDSPEYDLFPGLLGVRSVSVKVGFELRLATYALALLAVLRFGYGARTARLLELPAGLFRRLGCSGGAVMTELFYPDGSTRRAALSAPDAGQRMAALPCAYVAQALAAGEVRATGATTAYEFLGAGPLLQRLVAAGYELHVTPPA